MTYNRKCKYVCPIKGTKCNVRFRENPDRKKFEKPYLQSFKLDGKEFCPDHIVEYIKLKLIKAGFEPRDLVRDDLLPYYKRKFVR